MRECCQNDDGEMSSIIEGGLVARGVKWKTKVRVYGRDNYCCRYCGYDMTLHFPYRHLNVLTVDHVIPRHRGGTNEAGNLVTCCYWCNHDKGHRSADDFLLSIPGGERASG